MSDLSIKLRVGGHGSHCIEVSYDDDEECTDWFHKDIDYNITKKDYSDWIEQLENIVKRLKQKEKETK